MKSFIKITVLYALLFGAWNVSTLQAQGTQSSSSRTWTENPADIMTSDRLAGWRRAGLEGYTDKNSVAQGQSITFYVSVRNDLLPTNYNVEIYRVGATDVYKATVSGGPFTGQFFPLHDKNNQEVFPSDAGNPNKVPIEHRIGCNWLSAFTLSIPSNWPSGFYYAKLITTSTPAKFGAIPFVVKEDQPGSTSNMLVVIAWNTYAAYNYFGGGSLYWWTAQFDSLTKAYIDTVSFRRPFGHHLHDCCVQSDSLGQFNQRERHFINWAESNNDTLEYCIDLDVEQDNPSGLPLLSKYKAVLFPGHSEYWSEKMRLNISNDSSNTQPTTFMKLGGNVAFFAANNCYWKITYPNGDFNRMYCDKYTFSSLWRRQTSPSPGPEAEFMAVQFHGTNYPGFNLPNKVKNQNQWIFQGTNLVNGQAFGLGNPPAFPELASGEVDQTIGISPDNAEILAQITVRALVDTIDVVHYGEVDSLRSEMAYWEDTATNARVFSAAGLGWCTSLYGTDGAKIGTMTTNILEHFSFKKYRGNIYAQFLTWGDEALETATTLDGDTYILPGKTLTLTNNFLLTINSGVTLYVQGTLVIGSNVTITGGGKIVTSGSGIIKTESTTNLATAFNNSRKIAQDASGNHHIVFNAGGEICYEKWANNGTELKEFRRLSGSNGNNAYACIAERGGKVYVVWQRQDGSTYDVHFRKSATGGATWGPTTELFSNISQSTMLPVITSAATNKLMLVCRGGSGSTLRFRTSDDDGVTWAAAAAVPSSNSSDGYPTLAPTTSNSGGAREALAYSRTSPATIYYRYYMHGPDTTGWNAAVRNLSAVVPGTYTNHQRSSIAPSGTTNDKRLHVAWEAYSSGVNVVIHRKATNWYTWPNVYSVAYDNVNQQQLPSVTGLATDKAALLFRQYGQNQVYRMDYTGSNWCAATYVGQGYFPGVSMGQTTAKYVWTEGTASPYQIKIGSETLSGISPCPPPSLSIMTAQSDLGLLYHRSVAVLDTVTNAWLELRLNEISVKTLGGDELLLPFEAAQEDSFTLTPARAFVNLASSAFTLPADAESLFVSCLVGGQRLSSLKNGNTVNLSLAFTGRNGGSRNLPLVATNSDSISITTLKLAARITNFANSEASLRATVAGLGNKPTMIASLGHLYEITSQGLSKQTELVNQNAKPRTFEVRVHPNPFNPTTQIHFYLPTENVIAVRVYDVNGRMVKELVEGFRMAGEYTVTWDGRDELGRTVASGVYFSQVIFGEERKVAKMMLVR